MLLYNVQKGRNKNLTHSWSALQHLKYTFPLSNLQSLRRPIQKLLCILFLFKVDVVNRYIQPISGPSKKSPFYSLSCFQGCSWWHQCFLNKYAQLSFDKKRNITGWSPITIITRVSRCAQESWGSIERWHDVMSWWIYNRRFIELF